MSKSLTRNGNFAPVHLIENQRARALVQPECLARAPRASGAFPAPPCARARADREARATGGPLGRADHMPLCPTPYEVFGAQPQAEGWG